jgi:hypothetical protein
MDGQLLRLPHPLPMVYWPKEPWIKLPTKITGSSPLDRFWRSWPAYFTKLQEIWENVSRTDHEYPLDPIIEEANDYASFLVALEESYVEHPDIFKPTPQTAPALKKSISAGRAFIGHGRSNIWKDLKEFLADRLHLKWDEFNRESAAGKTSVGRVWKKC